MQRWKAYWNVDSKEPKDNRRQSSLNLKQIRSQIKGTHSASKESECSFHSFFPRTARLWNSVPVECLPMSCDLNGFKSKVNRNLWALAFS